MTVLMDGSPEWLPQVEKWLVGAAMLSKQEDVQTAAAVCTPEDFRDEALGRVWAVVPYVECPCWVHVSEALSKDDLDELGGEPVLVDLAYTQGAFLYANKVGLEAHAELVRQWAQKRREIQALGEQARAIYASRPANVTAIYDRPEYRGLDSAV